MAPCRQYESSRCPAPPSDAFAVVTRTFQHTHSASPGGGASRSESEIAIIAGGNDTSAN